MIRYALLSAVFLSVVPVALAAPELVSGQRLVKRDSATRVRVNDGLRIHQSHKTKAKLPLDLPAVDILEPFAEDNRFGVRNAATGKAVIPARYDRPIRFVSDGPPCFYLSAIIRVCQDGKWGFVLSDGRTLVEPVFDRIDAFTTSGLAAVKRNGKWGFVDTSGKLLVAPRFARTFAFTEGTAPATVDGHAWGFIRQDGTWAIPPKYGYAQPFFQNRAVIMLNEQYGVIDPSGRIIVPAQYDGVYNYQFGTFDIVLGNLMGTLTADGEVLVPLSFQKITAKSSDGHAD